MSNDAGRHYVTTGKQINGWTLAIILSVAIIAFGSVVIWSKYGRSQPIEITIVPPQELQGEIYIDGVVNNPGFYPLRTGDSLEDVIQAAGGVSDGADLTQLKLYISEGNEEKLAQKINLNRGLKRGYCKPCPGLVRPGLRPS